MINLAAGIILGFILTQTLRCFIDWIVHKKKYERNCKNCNHAVPYMSESRKIHLYCNLALDNNIQNYPVNEDNYCGHFTYTEELKAEQVREQAERYVKYD